jgi:magnesium chelatase family protein
VQEDCEHVRAAICNSGLSFSQSWLGINLAPANLSQEGPAYNLPIAVVILLVSEQIFADLIRGQPV